MALDEQTLGWAAESIRRLANEAGAIAVGQGHAGDRNGAKFYRTRQRAFREAASLLENEQDKLILATYDDPQPSRQAVVNTPNTRTASVPMHFTAGANTVTKHVDTVFNQAVNEQDKLRDQLTDALRVLLLDAKSPTGSGISPKGWEQANHALSAAGYPPVSMPAGYDLEWVQRSIAAQYLPKYRAPVPPQEAD